MNIDKGLELVYEEFIEKSISGLKLQDQSLQTTEDSIEFFKKDILNSWDIEDSDELEINCVKLAKKYAINNAMSDTEPFNDDWYTPRWDEGRIKSSLEGLPFELKLSESNSDELFVDIDVEGSLSGGPAYFRGHPDNWHPSDWEEEFDFKTHNIYMRLMNDKFITIDEKKVPKIWSILSNIAKNQLKERIIDSN
jgi:hypothetical protein